MYRMKTETWSPLGFYGRDRNAPIVLICEHASFTVPDEFDALGLDEDVLTSHVAGDIGALGVAKGLSDQLDAPLIYGGVSRLLYDCNRPFSAVKAVPEKSELFDIPGNAGLDDAERRARFERVHQPFHNGAAALVQTQQEKTGQPLTIITIHSFTPIYHNQTRDVELGFLHGANARLSESSCKVERERGVYLAELNQPYSTSDGVMHTLDKHSAQGALECTMIEIRNDLIGTAQQQAKMATHLGQTIKKALAWLDQPDGANR